MVVVPQKMFEAFPEYAYQVSKTFDSFSREKKEIVSGLFKESIQKV